MSKGKRRSKKNSFRKIVRNMRTFFLNLCRKIGRGIYFGIQYLKKLPRKTLLIGLASIFFALIAVIIILLASPKKKSVVTADPVGETVFASGNPDPSAQSFSGQIDTDPSGNVPEDPQNAVDSVGPADGQAGGESFTKLDEGDKSPLVAQI
ncbi:MAG: hypothetical protein IIV93_00375, partial [Clostridia bacterium]|nr:hypothetical protein [Clostridia bacterium]